PLAYAASGTGTVGVNITSTNQIAVYTSAGTNSSTLNFVPVAPPAAGSITLETDVASNMTSNVTGFTVENQGNVNVSINVTSSANAAAFIGGTSPLFKMWGVDQEAGSCATGLVAKGSAFNLGSSGSLVCGNLQYPDANDQVYAYMTITIPSDAPVSANSATITFTS
ncbi:MAG TPA: hypothetical protein PLO51_04855, partial [Candidatus Micrarchaeota archaeon]|nr:hypothetical protein [Candidatus Micrarchaeota archaeon]